MPRPLTGFLTLTTALTLGASSPAVAGPKPRVFETPVTAVDLRSREANNSPVVAVDPTDASFLALASRVDGPDYTCKLHLSSDGGQSWEQAKPVTTLPPGSDKCYGPEIAFDRSGRLYFLFVGLAGAGNNPTGAFLALSDDRGRTFSDPRPVLGPTNYQVRMVLDPDMGDSGRIHLVWLAATSDSLVGGLPEPPNPIMAAHSDDRGATFSSPVAVDSRPRRLVGVAVAVGRDHQLHVATYDLNDDVRDYQGLDGPTWEGTWSIVVSTSRDGGSTFEAPVVVDDAIAPPERVMLIYTMAPPSLVADGEGQVLVAWTDARHGDWDVIMRRSDDGGRTWQPPLRVNDDPQGNGRHQYLPRLALAPNGRVDVLFYDRRADPDNRRNLVAYSSSTDSGRRFGAAQILSTESSDTFVGARYKVVSARGRAEIGGRLGLLATDGGAVAAWADTRNAPGYAGPEGGPTTQDVFSAVIETAGDGGGNGFPVPLVLVIGFGLLVPVLAIVIRRRRSSAAL